MASLNDEGRAGIVCPQGVLFRGQPEIEEETGEFDDDGSPKIKRRKADDEHLIRKALLDSNLIDAVISLPLNIFYGAGVPACLLILRRHRPPERRRNILLIYAARHYRELSAQNELRPQDVMRILVHYYAYGDAGRVPSIVSENAARIHRQIDAREEEETGRILAEYQPDAAKLRLLDIELGDAREKETAAATRQERAKFASAIAKIDKQREKLVAKLTERDSRVAESRRRALVDRNDVAAVGEKLVALYAAPDELLKQVRLVDLAEIEENEYNLNIPRYVDTFEPEPRLEVNDALRALGDAETAMAKADKEVRALLKDAGYAH